MRTAAAPPYRRSWIICSGFMESRESLRMKKDATFSPASDAAVPRRHHGRPRRRGWTLLVHLHRAAAESQLVVPDPGAYLLAGRYPIALLLAGAAPHQPRARAAKSGGAFRARRSFGPRQFHPPRRVGTVGRRLRPHGR